MKPPLNIEIFAATVPCECRSGRLATVLQCEILNHLALLFSAHLIQVSWTQEAGASGRGRFDTPRDLSQILGASFSLSRRMVA